MLIEEAIKHCEEKAKCSDSCGKEHKQLADWLRELMQLRYNLAKADEASSSLLKDKIAIKNDLKAYPIIIDGRERRTYIASEVDALLSSMENTISSKDNIIRNLEKRLQIRQRVTPRTRSG
jgi:hypothetical protein